MNLKVKLKSKYKLDTSNISRCILPISVGQQYHEALKFFVTLKEIEKHFNHCVIIVCDTLQRHTMKFLEGLSCENAYNLAKFQGEQWLDRNKIHIKNLRLSVDLVH